MKFSTKNGDHGDLYHGVIGVSIELTQREIR